MIARDDVECGSLSWRTSVRWLDVRFPDGKGWTVCSDTRLVPWGWRHADAKYHPPIATGMTLDECQHVAVMSEAQAEAWVAQRVKTQAETIAIAEPGTWVAWDDVPVNTMVRVRGENDKTGHNHARAYAAVRFRDRGKWVLASGRQSQGDCDLALDRYRACWGWPGPPEEEYHARAMILGPAQGTHLASLAAQAQVAILSELLVDRWVAGLT